MILNRSIEDKTIEPAKCSIDWDRYFIETQLGGVQPILSSQNGDAVPAGTTGAINQMKLPNSHWEYFILGLGQTILGPRAGAAGLRVSLDLTDNEGAIYTPGGNYTSNPYRMVVGTDKAWFFRMKFTLADVSGTDECLVGFVKQKAGQTAHTGYDDYYFICIVTAANPAVVQTKTRLNAGTAATTDSLKTWADTETHTWEVKVDEQGRATGYIDGIQTNAPAFTFDSGDTLIPTKFFLHATTTPGAADWLEAECGPLDARRP